MDYDRLSKLLEDQHFQTSKQSDNDKKKIDKHDVKINIINWRPRGSVRELAFRAASHMKEATLEKVPGTNNNDFILSLFPFSANTSFTSISNAFSRKQSSINFVSLLG